MENKNKNAFATTIKENLTKETNFFFRPDTIRDICQKYF